MWSPFATEESLPGSKPCNMWRRKSVRTPRHRQTSLPRPLQRKGRTWHRNGKSAPLVLLETTAIGRAIVRAVRDVCAIPRGTVSFFRRKPLPDKKRIASLGGKSGCAPPTLRAHLPSTQKAPPNYFHRKAQGTAQNVDHAASSIPSVRSAHSRSMRHRCRSWSATPAPKSRSRG